MVENSVRRFENDQFKYPASDKSYTAQLLGYIVDHVSQSGRPVYKAQDEKAGDHFLDAVNLALLAFTLEKTALGTPTYNNDITFAGKFGESIQEQQARETKKADVNQRRTPPVLQAEQRTYLNQDQIPAEHRYNQLGRVYIWPGFERDVPPPSTSKGLGYGKFKLGGGRPQRNKF